MAKRARHEDFVRLRHQLETMSDEEFAEKGLAIGQEADRLATELDDRDSETVRTRYLPVLEYGQYRGFGFEPCDTPLTAIIWGLNEERRVANCLFVGVLAYEERTQITYIEE